MAQGQTARIVGLAGNDSLFARIRQEAEEASRREPELAVRSALGASTAALRRSLLAESIVLCGSGVLAALAIAAPIVAVLGRYAARFSVRAEGLTLDVNLVWFGIGLSLVAAVFLAYIPRLP